MYNVEKNMKAAIINRYGSADEFQIKEIETPKPRPDEVLINVEAASINPIDWKIRNGSLKLLFGSKFPMILGFDIAGVVAETGSGITKFKQGDSVYARSSNKPGGAYAQCIALKENVVALKPKNLDFGHAAAVPLACLTALQALRDKADFKPGHHILILGGSGGVGSFAIQLCKAVGATVTSTCSTDNMRLVKELGADFVIDYKKEDINKSKDRFHIIFDTVGKSNFWAIKHLLRPHGTFISTHPEKEFINQIITSIMGVLGGKKSKWILLKTNSKDLEYVTDLIESGKIKPIVDRVYPLDEIANAHRYSETGKAKGKIVIDIRSSR